MPAVMTVRLWRGPSVLRSATVTLPLEATVSQLQSEVASQVRGLALARGGAATLLHLPDTTPTPP